MKVNLAFSNTPWHTQLYNNLEIEMQFGKRTRSHQKTIDQKNLFVFDFWIWLVSIVIPVLKVEKHNHAIGLWWNLLNQTFEYHYHVVEPHFAEYGKCAHEIYQDN